jgi:hypothetical protein
LARNNKNLAVTFGDVATDERKQEVKQEIALVKNETEAVKKEAAAAADTTGLPSFLQDSGSKKKPPKENIGIYFDPDVAKVIKERQKKEGKGWKSSFISDVVRWAFEQKGWLEPKEKGNRAK